MLKTHGAVSKVLSAYAFQEPAAVLKVLRMTESGRTTGVTSTATGISTEASRSRSEPSVQVAGSRGDRFRKKAVTMFTRGEQSLPKCRFKYLFSKSEFDPIYPSYTALYKRPCKRSFIRFINSIARPTVEYVPDGRLPSEGDYLLTQDEAWNLKDVRKRKLGPGHDLVADSLAANRGVESMLYVMTDPSENAGRIGIKDR